MTPGPQTDIMRRATEMIESAGIVAVLRAADATRVRAVAEALADAGARAVEVTLTAPDALNAIPDLADTSAQPGRTRQLPWLT